MNINNEKTQILTESNSVPVNDSAVITDKKISIFLTMIKIYTLLFVVIVSFEFGLAVMMGGGFGAFAVFLGAVFVAICVFNLEKFWLIQICLNIGFLIFFAMQDISEIRLGYNALYTSLCAVSLGSIGLIFLYIFLKKNRSIFLQKIPGFIIVIGTIVYFIIVNRVWRLVVEILA